MPPLLRIPAAISCLVCSTLSSLAATHYVRTDGDDVNDGSSWADSYRTIQQALATATAGDEVWIAAGTYYPNDADSANLDRTQSFALKNGVAVYGGFAGTESSLGERDSAANPVILSGDLNRDDVDSDSDGRADTNTADNAYHVFYHSGSLDATAGLYSVTIRAGRADGSPFPHFSGGAMHNTASSPRLFDCRLIDNSAVFGGAIDNRSSSPTLTECTLIDNFASSGGAIYNQNSSTSLSRCNLSDNSASNGGAISVTSSSSVSITNCTISNNTASSGGAIYINSSSPILVNCTISNNSASFGGGIHNQSSSPTATNCILWGNSNEQIYGEGAILSHCIIQGGGTGININNQDPLLQPLGDNGGSTQTMLLAVGSPAIDSGLKINGVTLDQRRFSRDATPDIGACEFRQASLVSEENTNHYATGFSPQLKLDLTLEPNAVDWYLGSPGDTSSPILGTTGKSITLPPLTEDIQVWARITPTSINFDSNDSKAFSLTTSPPTLHVTMTGSDTAAGSAWSSALRTLNEAMTLAGYGAEVWIASGTYYPNDLDPSNLARTQSFALKNGVAVYGGFSGSESTLGERDFTSNPVILFGDLNRDDTDTNGDGRMDTNTNENAYHLFFHPATLALDSTASLDSVTIQGGNANNGFSTYYRRGGAMFNDRCSPTLTNCILTENFSIEDGGAIHNDFSSSPALTNCTLSYNFSSDSGGALSNYSSSSPSLINCTFYRNSASNGGALYNSNRSSPTLTNCTLVENSLNHGGAIRNSVSSPILTNCILWGNSIWQISGEGSILSHCIIQGGGAGTNIIDSNPLLLPFGDYGGQTPTIPIAFGSPAINTGLASAAPELDQRGVTRDGSPDVGACEFYSNESTPPLLTIIENETHFALGYSPQLQLLFEAEPLAIEWYYGLPGDTSFPIPGPSGAILTLPPVFADTGVWARLTTPSTTLDSLGLSLSIGPAQIYVSTSGDDANDGTTWESALRTPTAAITTAGYGAEVWIASGTYYPNDSAPANLDRTQFFALKNGVAVYGGFAGTESTLGERDSAANPVILSGDLNRDDTDTNGDGRMDTDTDENAYHVFYHPDSLSLDSSAILDSATITGGRANGLSDPYRNGGAMLNSTSSPTLSNCLLIDNFASSAGGAIDNNNSMPSLINCAFSQNASGGGGAIRNARSSPTLDNCSFNQNSASFAGAIFNNVYSSPILTGCILIGNSASGNGGAILNNYFSSPELLDCALNDNSCLNHGGAISNWDSSSPFLTGCTLVNNSSSKNGGAIFNTSNSSPSMRNCTLAENSASNRSGRTVFSEFSSFTMTNCTISNDGRGNSEIVDSSPATVLTNCIVVGSRTSVLVSRGSLTNCIIQGRATGTNVIDADPLLLPLGDYGGPTQTMPPALGSVAIDMPGTTDPGGFDQRGLPRFVGGALDIGAVEVQSTETTGYFSGLWGTDIDGDGVPWGAEHALGTDPYAFDPTHPAHLSIPAFTPDGHATFTFGYNPEAQAGTVWTLKRSTNLESFTEIYRYDGIAEIPGSDVSSLIGPNSFSITDEDPPDGKAFYRFEAIYQP